MHLELKSRLRLGVSSCLAGEAVRYDGGHRREHWLMDRLAAFSELTRVCPESVLGTPREPMHLVRDERGALRVIGRESATDFTDTLAGYAQSELDQIDLDALDGWVFKSGSPSCAIETIEVIEDGQSAGRARGRFAAALLDRSAFLPVIDEEQLLEPSMRRHFMERACARAHWREFLKTLPDDAGERDRSVSAWLSRFDLQLRAREQSPVVGHPGTCDAGVLRGHAHLLFASLDPGATRAGQAAALREAGNHLQVHEHEYAGLAILIREFEDGKMDVEVPRQLLRGLCARGGDAWLRNQHFLAPFPEPWQSLDAKSLPFAPAVSSAKDS